MKVGVPKETLSGEKRVALVPDIVERLVARGLEILVEPGAGTQAGFSDQAYQAAGATIAPGAAEVWAADVVVKVSPPQVGNGIDETTALQAGGTLIGFLLPLTSPELIRRLAEKSVTSFSMELVPRITIAQRMDALSSQATVSGYLAAVEGALRVDKFLPMLTTAAGTIPPGKVLVIGAGVAGLMAIATARRLGARVKGFDIRPAAKDQVESLGAQFVGLEIEDAETKGGYAKEVTEEQQRKEHELLHDLCVEADVVITTALVPGKKAPLLITEDIVRDMRPGSVVIDLAAEMGGNCEGTRPGEEVSLNGVRVLGMINAPSGLPLHASQMYARNIQELLLHLYDEEARQIKVDSEDEITRECCITHGGKIVHPRTLEATGATSNA